MDLAQLEENVSHFLGQALAPATLRSYKSGQARYFQFCQDAGLQPLPLTEQVLCMFVAHLGTESLSHQTLKCYLSAIRHFSIMAGQGDPFRPGAFPVLQYVLRGVRRNPKPAKPRLPITPEILRHLRTVVKMLGRWELAAYQRYIHQNLQRDTGSHFFTPCVIIGMHCYAVGQSKKIFLSVVVVWGVHYDERGESVWDGQVVYSTQPQVAKGKWPGAICQLPHMVQGAWWAGRVNCN